MPVVADNACMEIGSSGKGKRLTTPPLMHICLKIYLDLKLLSIVYLLDLMMF